MSKLQPYIVLVITIILFVVGLSIRVLYSKEITALLQNENEESASEPTEEQNPSKESKEILDFAENLKATYTYDFEPNTNYAVPFGYIEFQIPNTWSVIEQNGTVVYLNGREESLLGPMSIELLATEISEADLAGEECQQAVITAYSHLLLSTFSDLECTDAAYDEVSEVFSVLFEGLIDTVYASWTLYAFVENNDLYVYSAPFCERDRYNYELDINEVLWSVVPEELFKEVIVMQMIRPIGREEKVT